MLEGEHRFVIFGQKNKVAHKKSDLNPKPMNQLV